MSISAKITIVRLILKLWRIHYMYKQTKNIARNIGIGLAAGTAVAAIGATVVKNKKKPSNNMKRTAGKAVHTVNSLLGDVERMLK